MGPLLMTAGEPMVTTLTTTGMVSNCSGVQTMFFIHQGILTTTLMNCAIRLITTLPLLSLVPHLMETTTTLDGCRTGITPQALCCHLIYPQCHIRILLITIIRIIPQMDFMHILHRCKELPLLCPFRGKGDTQIRKLHVPKQNGHLVISHL